MKTLTSSHILNLGRSLADTELAAFSGGAKEGGCIPDHIRDLGKKLGVTDTTTAQQ